MSDLRKIMPTLFFQIHETVETINQLKVSREFFLGFAQGPQVRI